MKDSPDQYWQEFLSTLPAGSPYHSKSYIAEGWGDGPEMADELGALIATGIKTQPAVLYGNGKRRTNRLLKREQSPLSWMEAGSRCASSRASRSQSVSTTKWMLILPEKKAKATCSLAYWREAHRRFFSRSLPKVGREFSEDMPLVCERFHVIYKSESEDLMGFLKKLFGGGSTSSSSNFLHLQRPL